jgi:hypothetical protein
MTINSLPPPLQPIVQDNYLDHIFEDSLCSKLGCRGIADREPVPIGIGETITKTRAGLLVPTITPLDPATDLALDNGLTPQCWSIEQFTLGIDTYGATMDLNMETSLVAIDNLFLVNAGKLAFHALQSLDRLARNALYSVTLGGNSFVTAGLGAPSSTLKVDTVVGFETVAVNGALTPISAANPMAVTVGNTVYSLIGTSRDTVNVSSLASLGGASGTLTFSSAVAVADASLGAAVVSSLAPTILRPNGRAATSQLVNGDQLTLHLVLAAVARLRDDNVPDFDGSYHCYLDNTTLLELFRDPDFKHLYSGQANAEAYRDGQVIRLLGVAFIPTTEAPQQTLALTGQRIHRAIVCGQGALIEGDFEGLGQSDLEPDPTHRQFIDGVCLLVREPLDRFQEIIAQSWKWRGGFCVPTDVTADPAIIPTAGQSYWKRAVVLECL